jgi:hypothetical protein
MQLNVVELDALCVHYEQEHQIGGNKLSTFINP